MDKLIIILNICFQIVLTFIATFCIYIVFALFDIELGIDGLFGLFIIQPIIAINFSVLTIFVCLIVGLPIRLHKKLNHWWTTNFYISIIGTICGVTLLFLALLPVFNETVTIISDGQKTLKQIPNSALAYIGWFLTAFSLIHMFLPRQLKYGIKRFFSPKEKKNKMNDK